MNSLTFKRKSKKVPLSDPRKNIYTLHQEKIDYFEELQNSLPTRRADLEKKKKRYEKNNEEFREFRKKGLVVPFEIVHETNNLRSEIKEIEIKIKDIENRKEEYEYYLNASPVLMKYSEELNRHNNETGDIEDADADGYDNMEDLDLDLSLKEIDKSKEVLSPTIPQRGLKNIINVRKTSNRTDLLDDYLLATDRFHHSNKNFSNPDINICVDCNENKIFHEAENTLVCPKCCVVTECFINPTGYKPTYKETQDADIQPYFCYKKINHFNEWLSQIQAKETTDIPLELLEKLSKEIRKERANPKSLTPKKVKVYLKKLGENKYYEHAVQIKYLLNGVKPLTMSLEMEEKLRKMFEQLQAPFEKHKPKNRKNFLSYSYVLHKFCQLLHYDEFLPYFPLLKSREKLYQQDVTFKKCCKDLGWMFIPSI